MTRMVPCSIRTVNPFAAIMSPKSPGEFIMTVPQRLQGTFLGLAIALLALGARAEWPDHPIKCIVRLAPSGAIGVNWTTAGTASTPHFVAEMLKDAGVSKLNVIPYKSGSESVTAVIAGNVNATSEASIVVLPQVKAGKLRAIATTYETRITA